MMTDLPRLEDYSVAALSGKNLGIAHWQLSDTVATWPPELLLYGRVLYSVRVVINLKL
jgi:hypothetical protein